MGTTILLADDHIVLRDGLCAIIEREPDLKIVGQASTGRDAVELAKQLCPDVVLMDVSMPDLNGVDATRRIVTLDRKVKVIALSAHAEREIVLSMLEAGAWGYLVKSAAWQELISAVRAVVGNQKYLSPSVAGLVVDGYTGRHLPSHGPLSAVLTDREREILQLLAEGSTSHEIAHALAIAESTVDVHRKNISKKLNLHSIAELTKYAIRQGLTSA